LLKFIKKIFLAVSAVLLYLTVKEFLQLYSYLSSINIYLAIVVLIVLAVFIIYFGIYPLIQIIFLPSDLGPTFDRTELQSVIDKRVKKLRRNNFLIESEFDFSEINNDEQSYGKLISAINPEVQRIRKKHVNSVFYGTAVSQNGFLDAIMIFSASIKMIKEIFTLYNGRTNNRDLLAIGKNVYYSIVIGGSEGIEYASEEVFSKLATDSMKSIPFLDKIFSSLADGFVNALLLTRISLITENYCTKLFIENRKELFPNPSFVIDTAKDLTKDVVVKIKSNLLALAKEKTENLISKAFNPVILVFDKGYTSLKENKTISAGGNFIKRRFNDINIFKKK